MESFYKFFITLQSTLPLWVTATVTGLLISWLLVQAVKFWFPIDWPSEFRKQFAQLLAFFTAFGVVIAMMGFYSGIYFAVISGLGSPIAYAGLMVFLRWKFPKFADLLDGDTRGVWFGEKRVNKDNL